MGGRARQPAGASTCSLGKQASKRGFVDRGPAPFDDPANRPEYAAPISGQWTHTRLGHGQHGSIINRCSDMGGASSSVAEHGTARPKFGGDLVPVAPTFAGKPELKVCNHTCHSEVIKNSRVGCFGAISPNRMSWHMRALKGQIWTRSNRRR